jgi:hypothetical protein
VCHARPFDQAGADAALRLLDLVLEAVDAKRLLHALFRLARALQQRFRGLPEARWQLDHAALAKDGQRVFGVAIQSAHELRIESAGKMQRRRHALIDTCRRQHAGGTDRVRLRARTQRRVRRQNLWDHEMLLPAWPEP